MRQALTRAQARLMARWYSGIIEDYRAAIVLHPYAAFNLSRSITAAEAQQAIYRNLAAGKPLTRAQRDAFLSKHGGSKKEVSR